MIWGTGKRIGPNLKGVYTSSQKGKQGMLDKLKVQKCWCIRNSKQLCLELNKT